MNITKKFPKPEKGFIFKKPLGLAFVEWAEALATREFNMPKLTTKQLQLCIFSPLLLAPSLSTFFLLSLSSLVIINR